ncbi:glycine cleavage system aminomethyltransferase GcvT [Moorella naiadis]|uniref:glycine cleavage system aminomethyltransferase GcvT n=1 Tax=Moorella naiadis (nom. illeg.) TaxID=3093670 RepID=UPI003D9C9CDB
MADLKASDLKQTPLYAEHVAAGAKMVEFGGWLMPVQYSGIIEEHQRVRTAAGLFDVSHMGEITIKGPDALKLVQKLVTNDASRATGDRVVYSPMCYLDGGVVDDLLIYPRGEGEYLLVVNAGNIDKDFAWIQEHTAGFQVEVKNISPATAQLALQGPRALAILQPLTKVDLAPLGYYRWTEGEVLGVHCLISRTGYTGEDGFELYFEAAAAPAMWRQLLAAGQEAGLVPAGLGARDTLRLEAALPLYGHELSPTISPLEAGLGRFVRLDKGEFNGREALAAQQEAGVKRQLMGLTMLDRGIPRPGYPVLAGGREIGQVTSGSPAPTLGQNIALALVEAGTATVGGELEVGIRGRANRALVVKLPFYRRPQ